MTPDKAKSISATIAKLREARKKQDFLLRELEYSIVAKLAPAKWLGGSFRLIDCERCGKQAYYCHAYEFEGRYWHAKCPKKETP